MRLRRNGFKGIVGYFVLNPANNVMDNQNKPSLTHISEDYAIQILNGGEN